MHHQRAVSRDAISAARSEGRRPSLPLVNKNAQAQNSQAQEATANAVFATGYKSGQQIQMRA